MKSEIGSDYNDTVAFYLVSSEPVDRLTMDKERNGYPWTVAHIGRAVWEDLNIFTQGSKVALSGEGVILHRYGYGRGDFASWNALFDDISAN